MRAGICLYEECRRKKSKPGLNPQMLSPGSFEKKSQSLCRYPESLKRSTCFNCIAATESASTPRSTRYSMDPSERMRTGNREAAWDMQ